MQGRRNPENDRCLRREERSFGENFHETGIYVWTIVKKGDFNLVKANFRKGAVGQKPS